MPANFPTPSLVVVALADSFCHEIIERKGLLLLSTEQARSDGRAVVNDPIGYESTMNKRYVSDLCRLDEDARDVLMTVGRALIRVWSERVTILSPARDVLFYLGGSESVILRFHVRRPGQADWTDLSDYAYLAATQIEVYLLHDGNLTRC